MRKQSCMKPQVAMTALMGLFLTVPLFTNSRKGPNIVSSATAWGRRVDKDHVCILATDLEHAAGPDHVGEAGGPGGQHHAHQHQRLEEGELRQGRLEAVPGGGLQLTWTMYMQSCCSSAGSQVRLVSTLSTRNTVKVVRQPHSVPRGMFLAGDTRSPDLNSKQW